MSPILHDVEDAQAAVFAYIAITLAFVFVIVVFVVIVRCCGRQARGQGARDGNPNPPSLAGDR